MTSKTLLNYFNGQWTESISGKRRSCFNPADRQQEISSMPVSTPEEVEKVIAAAHAAFNTWRRIPASKRADMLRNALDAIKAREEECAKTITLENGKTIRESRTEVLAAIKEFDFQLGQGRRLGGPNLGSDLPGVSCYLRREPLGVVSLITPWNFPFNVACRKIVPALVAGNCCVLKPADQTPMCAAFLFEALETAGLPKGVANLVFGRGSVIGDTLVTHQNIKAVSFTGSTDVGVGIATKLSGRATKIQLEMGGKNPLVVLADADLEQAAEAAVVGAYSCAGQWCTSTSRVIVEAAAHDKFLDILVNKAKGIKVGNGFDESVRVGPVCGVQQYEGILNYIEIGKQEGARLCCGGGALTEGALANGYFVAPTVFSNVTPEMRIAREEIFGPVLSVMMASDLDEAIRHANDIIFGLSSSIFTRDLAKAQRFVCTSDVGLCHVNMHTAYKEPQLEFGGVKDSGRGLPEAGESGIQFFTNHKAVYVRDIP